MMQSVTYINVIYAVGRALSKHAGRRYVAHVGVVGYC